MTFNIQNPENTSKKEPYVQFGQDFLSSPNSIKTFKHFLVKNVFRINDAEVSLNKGITLGRTEVAGINYTVASSDYIVGITSLTTPITIGLPHPSSVNIGKTFIIKDEVGGAGTTTITVRPDREALINGSTSAAITTNYGNYQLYSNGQRWLIID